MWIFLLFIVALLLLTSKERFNPATERPTAADPSVVSTVASYTGLSSEKDMAKINKYITALQSFYDDKYLPKKETPTPEQVKSFVDPQTDPDLDKAILGPIIEYMFLSTTPAPPAVNPDEAPTPAPQDAGTSAGVSTGGTSTSSAAPTSGTGSNIWGPEYAGMGNGGGNPSPGDTTGSRAYPSLIGPKPDGSTMYPGAGIGPPSKNWQLGCNGSLPSPDSLGSTEASQYLPCSRTPGDQDLIPNPYLVSTSIPSSKTEPVPFLSDFSAFQK